jgi:LuxR family maltose regulon positive regulatory protein
MSISLLRTKLYQPPMRPAMIPRQRLVDKLNTGLWSNNGFERKLTLISAPAGFGKTTLVTEWVAGLRITPTDFDSKNQKKTNEPNPSSEISNNIAWLSLDEVDNDSERFLIYLIAALQVISPDIGLEAQVVLEAGAPLALDNALTLLVNDIATFARPLILILDDYHVIHTEAVNQLLVALLEHQPLNFHLVIVSRADPPLPLSRLRGRQQMLELRVHNLRFTEVETTAFLNQIMGLNLSPELIAALEQHTEGWIAGLQLAALSLQGCDDAEAFIQTFSGSNRYIIDYLVDEVLQCQPPGVRNFLAQTSVLDWLCAPLCDAVMGYDDTRSQDILDYLERNNLFLISLDDQRKWYRYHHLFADSLRTELNAAQLILFHQRAARWYEENDFLPRAIQHALTAPDFELAAELLGEAGREAKLWAGGDFKRYCAWVEMLPEAVRQAHPRLQLVFARALQITGELARAEQVLTKVSQALQAAPVLDLELTGITAMYQAQCLLERGELARAADLAHYAVTHLSESTQLNYARALSSLACIEYGLGHFIAATPRFTQVSHTSESPSLSMNAAECAARCLLLQGQLRVAQRMSEHLLTSARIKTTYNHLAAGAFATLSEIYYYQDTVERIQTCGEQAIELAQRMAPKAPLRAHEIWVNLQLARFRQIQGDENGAIKAIAQADQVASEISNTFYLELAQVRQMAFQLGYEHNIPPLLRVRTYPPVAFSYLVEYKRWIQVQLLLAQRHPQEALVILDELLDSALRDGRGLSVIELQVWRALIHHTLKQPTATTEALTQAVALAAPEDCMRVFLDVGPQLTSLLVQVRSVAPDFVTRLLLALETERHLSAAKSQSSHNKPPIGQPAPLNIQLEMLSEREIEILRLLDDGLSNHEISRKLFIGVGTVKWYLTNLYDKLDVANRTQAVGRARELGIVQ